MRLPARTVRLASLCLAIALPLSGQAANSLITEAREHLAKGQAAQAYTLLAPHDELLAGKPDYDYLLGIAALRAGHPVEAMLALERVVNTRPDHAAARMELISAYLQLGLDHHAQDQLSILEGQQPPAAARATMDRYQDILQPRLSGTPDPLHQLSLSAGYDSNTGSYPDMGLELGGLNLSINPIESGYALLRGTVWHPLRLGDQQRLDLTLHGQYRHYQEEEAQQFNLGLLHGAVLLNQRINAYSQLGLGLQGNKLWLDGEGFRDHLGVSARWEQRLGVDLRGDLALELQDYRFAQALHDYRQYNLTSRLFKTLSHRLRIGGLLAIEQEDAQNERFGGDATRWRVQGDLSWQFNPRHLSTLTLGWSDTRYQQAYPAYGLHNPEDSERKRNDQIAEIAARWRYFPAQSWEINSELNYRDQDSTIQFYNIERWTAQLTLLRNF